VNTLPIQIPYTSSDYSIFYSGGRVRLQTTFGLAVEFDGNHYVVVYVPSAYYGVMCGLCGNNDDNPTNDLTLANGTYVGNQQNAAILFGDSYVVDDPEQPDTS
jgi:hypothetical protein